MEMSVKYIMSLCVDFFVGKKSYSFLKQLQIELVSLLNVGQLSFKKGKKTEVNKNKNEEKN